MKGRKRPRKQPELRFFPSLGIAEKKLANPFITKIKPMKNLSLTILLVAFAFLLPVNHLFAATEEIVETLTEYKDYTFNFLLPINFSNKKINLLVNIPKDFKVLENPPGAEFLEFVPQNDHDPDAWSEIITLTPYIGKKFSSKNMVQFVVSGIKKSASNLKVISENYQKYDGYEDASCMVRYTHQSRDELLMLYAVSGPYDAALVQYAIHLKDPGMMDMGMKKISDFFKTYVKIMK
jgi:hypothetical protein